MVPTGNEVINDQFSTGGPNYREFLYNLVNFASQAQNFDGNGPYFRLQGGGGSELVGEGNPNAKQGSEKFQYARTIAPPQGTQPQIGNRPPLKPDVRCYTNSPPDVNGPLGQVGPSSAGVVNP
jgi:hypothetical protein